MLGVLEFERSGRQSPRLNYLMRCIKEPLLALSSVTELLWVFTTQTWVVSNA